MNKYIYISFILLSLLLHPTTQPHPRLEQKVKLIPSAMYILLCQHELPFRVCDNITRKSYIFISIYLSQLTSTLLYPVYFRVNARKQ